MGCGGEARGGSARDGNGGGTMELRGKKIIALGERDGVQGGSIAACAREAGAEVVLEKTYCFV